MQPAAHRSDALRVRASARAAISSLLELLEGDRVGLVAFAGTAYVAEDGRPLNAPGSSGSLAWVPVRDMHAVIKAAEECPGECIFIEEDAAYDQPRSNEDVGEVAR